MTVKETLRSFKNSYSTKNHLNTAAISQFCQLRTRLHLLKSKEKSLSELLFQISWGWYWGSIFKNSDCPLSFLFLTSFQMAIHKVSILKKVGGKSFRKSCKSGLKTLPYLFKVLSILNKVKGSYWQLSTLIFIWKLQKSHLFLFSFPSVFWKSGNGSEKCRLLSSLETREHLPTCQY